LQVTPPHRVLQHRSRPLVALFALALVACLLAACGSSGGGGGSNDAQTLLKQTFTGTHKIDSGKANLQLSVDAQTQGSSPLNGPIKVAVKGPFQSAGKDAIPKFDLAIDIGASGQSIQAGLTSTSDQLYVDFGGTAYQAPATLVAQLKQSFQRSAQQSTSSAGKLNLAGLGLDPMSWLSDASVAGKETVGGVETEHITAKLNVSALLDDVDKVLAKLGPDLGAAATKVAPRKIPAGTRKQIEDAVKSATVDVWTGADDKTLRKLALALDVQPASGSVKHVSLALSIELSDLNKPQTIKAPANPRPLSELLGQLQGLFGGALPGLGGGGSTPGGAQPTPGAAGSAQVQKYAQCLKDAGGDVTKAQACADLLTK
jgi:hypothetical protein